MGFSNTNITSVLPPVPYGASLLIKWTSNAPPGTFYQVYVNSHLSYSGTILSCSVPIQQGTVYLDIGTVDTADAYTDFSADLGEPKNRALLKWMGGTFEGADISGFHVYQSLSANEPISYVNYVADINAYIGGIITDGYGYGGYGDGGYGFSSASYSWTSGTLTTGTWGFGVKPYDLAGNEGPSDELYMFWGLPPQEPAPWPTNDRIIHYTLIDGSGPAWNIGGYGAGGYPALSAVLTWLPSPG